jgi:hypothetical protein
MERGERERMMSNALWHFLPSAFRSGVRIASSTCTARLINQAAGLLSSLPCHRHPLWPARLCRCHQPGPGHRDGTTLTAYRPTGTMTAVQTLQPTFTSPLPPHAGPSCRRHRLSLSSPRRLLPAPTPGTPRLFSLRHSPPSSSPFSLSADCSIIVGNLV